MRRTIDTSKTDQLAEWRKSAGLTQVAVAAYFEVERRAIGAWESGKNRPHATRRNAFLVYLIDKLKLRHNPTALLEFWNQVVTAEWGWAALTDAELRRFFPSGKHRLRKTAVGQTLVPFLVPPHPEHALIGRDSLLHALKKKLFTSKRQRHFVLTGLPGVGKSALALSLSHDEEVLAHFQDGILWAGLGRSPDILELLGQWCLALDVPAAELAQFSTIPSRSKRLQSAIKNRRILFVLDDVWSVNDAIHFQPGGPNCAFLITTRLPQVGAQLSQHPAQTVPELSAAAGISLLRQLAPEAVTLEPEAAQSLVAQVGSLPLALILMGNYLRKQGYSQQARRIRNALNHLQQPAARLQLSSPQAAANRHPSGTETAVCTLEKAISLSLAALSSHAVDTLQQLTLFPPKPNSFNEAMALAVTNVPPEILDELVDAGLLETSPPDRYLMHQAIHDVAQTGAMPAAVVARMVATFAEFINAHQQNRERLEQEQENWLAALNHAYEAQLWPLLLQMTQQILPYLQTRGQNITAVTLLQRAQEAAIQLKDNAALFDLLLSLASCQTNLGKMAEAEAALAKAQTIAYETEDSHRIAQVLSESGRAYGFQGKYDACREALTAALPLAEETDDYALIGRILLNLGNLAYESGDIDQQITYYLDHLKLADQHLKDDINSLRTRSNLGVIYLNRGEVAKAKKAFTAALTEAERLNYIELQSVGFAKFGDLYTYTGEYRQAKENLDRALALAYQTDRPDTITLSLTLLANWAIKTGRFTAAHNYLQEGFQQVGNSNLNWEKCALFLFKGDLHMAQSQLAEAQNFYRQGYSIAQEIELHLLAEAAFRLAKLAMHQHDYAVAHAYALEALPIYQSFQHRELENLRALLASLPDSPTSPAT